MLRIWYHVFTFEVYVRFIWKIIKISKYEKMHYKYIEIRFFVFWGMDNFLDETGIMLKSNLEVF